MRHYISFSGRGGRRYFQRGQGRHLPAGPERFVSSEFSEESQPCPHCRHRCHVSEPGCEKGREFFRG